LLMVKLHRKSAMGHLYSRHICGARQNGTKRDDQVQSGNNGDYPGLSGNVDMLRGNSVPFCQ
jgi:hypothetical protein